MESRTRDNALCDFVSAVISEKSNLLDGVYEILLGSPESAAPDISYINL